MTRSRDQKIRLLYALQALAADQSGKPEGELARQKIAELIAKYPDLRPALVPYRELTLKDIGFMRRHGISTEGSWTAATWDEVMYKMQYDYCQRIDEYLDGIPESDILAEPGALPA